MADLFTLEELASYMQSDLDAATATLARLLTTTLIRNEIGATRYDALTDLTPLKPVALDVAARIMDVPKRGKRSDSYQIDDYTETTSYATEMVAAGAALTPDEVARVLAAAGIQSTGAFTIRPAGCQPAYYC